jgi:hypothetical protein
MAMVSERIMGRYEIAEITAETSNGESNSEGLFGLLIEIHRFRIFLSKSWFDGKM